MRSQNKVHYSILINSNMNVKPAVPVTAAAFWLSLDQSASGLRKQFGSNAEINGSGPYHFACGWELNSP
jgi:hypothetical protein